MTRAKYERCKRALARFTVIAPRYLPPEEQAEYVRRREVERNHLAFIVDNYSHRPSRNRVKGRPAEAA